MEKRSAGSIETPPEAFLKSEDSSKKVKILVTGPFNAGKTTFIKTLSIIPPVLTEKKIYLGNAKCSTTLALDFGITYLQNYKLYLFGTPGQERFNFLLEILSKGIDGCIVLLDVTNRAFDEDLKKYLSLFGKGKVPMLIALNKTDLKEVNIEILKEKLHVNIPLISITAKDKSSSMKALEKIISLITQPFTEKLGEKQEKVVVSID